MAITNTFIADPCCKNDPFHHYASVSEDKAVSHDNASEVFQSPLDESEQGEFVDYSWANVGSFEDLDRIFR